MKEGCSCLECKAAWEEESEQLMNWFYVQGYSAYDHGRHPHGPASLIFERNREPYLMGWRDARGDSELDKRTEV